MSETQTYNVIMVGDEYLSNADTGATSMYLHRAVLFLNMDAASWYVSERYRHGMPQMNIKTVRMTVEDDNG